MGYLDLLFRGPELILFGWLEGESSPILVECNHFAQEMKDIFSRKDVVESFRFHPTLLSCLWDGAYKRTLAVNR